MDLGIGVWQIMSCKGICEKYRAIGSFYGGRYNAGQKRCQKCDLFIICDGLRCPCCGYRLRTKPRNKEYKDKLVVGWNRI